MGRTPRRVVPDSHSDWLIHDGETGALLRSVHWAGTTLGPLDAWPQALRVVTNTILASAFPMAILWGNDLNLIYNDAYRIIAGRKHPQAMGRPTREVWPEIWDFIGPVAEKVVTQGQTLVFEQQPFRLHRHNEPEEAYFTLSYSPIWQEDGSIGGVLVVLLEDTQRRLAERGLRASQQLLSNVIDSTPSVIFAFDLQHRFTLLNQAMSRFYGMTKEQVLGKTLHDVFPKEIADQLLQVNQQIIESGRPFFTEEVVMSKHDRVPRHLMTSKFPLRDLDGKIVGLGGVATDITELKRLESELRIAKEKAEEAAQSRARFLDIAAHELRNPVTAMSLLLQLAEKDLKAGKLPDSRALERLKEPSDRLVQLVVDLLDVSRLERGLLQLRRVRADLAALVSKCVDDMKVQAPARSFLFEKPAQPVELTMDPLRINQVLLNLLDNAVKYTPPEGPIEVRLELLPRTVRVSVVDQGPGIPPQEMKGLFNAFSRGASDATARESGLGLGLSVCRGIVDLHGGTIGVSSEPGKGSTFTVELPREGSLP